MEDRTFHLVTASGQRYGPGTMEQMCQWAREGRVPRDASLLPVAGGAAIPVAAVAELAAILNAPPTIRPDMTNAAAPPAPASGLIPYRNPPALIGYYTAVFSLIPCLALLLGPAAIVLGIVGIVKRNKQPECKGLAHAWVAIVLGSLTTIGNVAAIIVLPRW